MRNTIIALCVLLTGCVALRTRDNDVDAVLAKGVVSLEASISLKGNVMPWEKAELKEGDILISNSCGFGSATYRTCPVGDGRTCTGTVTVRFLRGEWCEVGEFVYDQPTFLLLRRWNGSNYLLDHVETFAGSDEHRYIVKSSFLTDWDLMPLAVDLASSRVCLHKDWLTSDQLKGLEDEGNSFLSSDQLCFKRGVSIEEASKYFSNRPLKKRRAKKSARAS